MEQHPDTARLQRLVGEVEAMREAQKLFYRYVYQNVRGSVREQALEEAKRLERSVDRLLKDIAKGQGGLW